MSEPHQIFCEGPKTRRLTHRALTPRDAEFFFRLNSNPDVMRLTGDRPIESVAEARRAIQDYPDFIERGFGRWGCVLTSACKLIGTCGLKYLPEFDEVDIGYRFFPEYWGKGFATEACIACLSLGFETLELERILALAVPENRASHRVMQKAGMTLDGNVLTEGVPAIRYVITRDQYLANHRPNG